MDKYLLEIKDLETSIKIENKWYPTRSDIFKLRKNEILGVVGNRVVENLYLINRLLDYCLIEFQKNKWKSHI